MSTYLGSKHASANLMCPYPLSPTEATTRPRTGGSSVGKLRPWKAKTDRSLDRSATSAAPNTSNVATQQHRPRLSESDEEESPGSASKN